MVSMSRTNIDIDDELIVDVMRRYRLSSKREAVDYALREVRGRPMSRAEMLALGGIGWDGPSIEELRPPVREFSISPERAAALDRQLER